MGAQITQDIYRGTALKMFNTTMLLIKEKRHRDMESLCDETDPYGKGPREFCAAFYIKYRWVFDMKPDQISNRDLEEIVSLPYFRRMSCHNYTIVD